MDADNCSFCPCSNANNKQLNIRIGLAGQKVISEREICFPSFPVLQWEKIKSRKQNIGINKLSNNYYMYKLQDLGFTDISKFCQDIFVFAFKETL